MPPLSSRAAIRALLPLLAGALTCLVWMRLHIHTGLYERLELVSRNRVDLNETQILFLLWMLAVAAAALGPVALRQAGRRVPVPVPAWSGYPPPTIEDRLAAATFGAYAANRAVATAGGAGVAHRCLGPVVVALGGVASHAAGDAFQRWAGRRPVVWYGTGAAGPGCLRIGQEAIVRPAWHDLESPRLANLRHSIARARRAGVVIAGGAWAELPPDLQAQLRGLAGEVRRHHRRRPPLTLTLSRFEDAMDGRPWAVATCGDRVEAAATWLEGAGERGLVLDIMWRRPDATPGAMELLLEHGIQAARRDGRPWVSLGVCGEPGQPGWLRRLNPPGLRRFKEKFAPEWHDRYVAAPAIPRVLALAAVALAHLAPAPTAYEEPA